MAFTTEQVAAYIRDQGLSPAEAEMAAQAFGISATQLAAAQAMLAWPDQSAVDDVSQAYAADTSAADKAANDAWVAEQLARDEAAQQAELDRIQAVRDAEAQAAKKAVVAPVTPVITPPVVTPPVTPPVVAAPPAVTPPVVTPLAPQFTTEQVAAYIRDQAVAPTDIPAVAAAFGVAPEQATAAQTMLQQPDQTGVNTASQTYADTVAAQPELKTQNDTWAADQLARDQAAQQAELDRVNSVKELEAHRAQVAEQTRLEALGRMSVDELLKQDRLTLPADYQQKFDQFTADQANRPVGGLTKAIDTPAVTTNPGAFTPAQVASYIQDQNVAPADYASTAAMFGVSPDLLKQGTDLLANNDPSVASTTAAYDAAIASNPAQGALNDSWVAAQAANTPAQQAATLNAIDTVKSPVGALTQAQGTTMPITDNPGNLTAANVAAYIRDQGVKPADYAATAEAFGIPMSLLTQGLYLLARNDPSVQATSKAYSDAIAANPAQGTANNAWVAQQLAAPSSVQQNTLGVIDAFKNNAPVTNPSGFTAAQVAAYIRDQKIAPTDYAKTASMFGVDPALLSAGVDLLNANSPQIQTVSDLYKQQIAANPSLGEFNNAWVGAQSAATPAQQQAELGRIAAVRAGQPTTTSPIVNPTVGPLTTTSRPPVTAPSTAANSFDTPVLNALYSQQRQNMTSAAPTFNFQAKPQFRNGGLTRAIRGC